MWSGKKTTEEGPGEENQKDMVEGVRWGKHTHPRPVSRRWVRARKPSTTRRAFSTPDGSLLEPFFANVDELLALRDSLEEEGLIARLTAIPISTDQELLPPSLTVLKPLSREGK